MFQYFDKIKEKLDIVEIEEKETITQASSMLTKAIQEKNAIYIFGASHAGILVQEMFYRAGGLMPINPIFGREIMLDNEPITLTSQMERLDGYGTVLAKKVSFKKDDVLILHSVSGRNPIIIDLALEAKKHQVKLIGLTNLAYSKTVDSRHFSKKRLFELCDVVIDNHGEIGDAMCTIDGLEQKVAPSSTVIGATILNTIVTEVCQQLVNQGMTQPPIFYSANIDGGDQLNEELYQEYKKIIHYKF
ncbi:sugar isomerase domain-containing protein [Enterococcus sp. LJL99]